MSTVRLDVLAKINGRFTREAIRDMEKAETTPWDDDGFPEDGYRRYDGSHALSLVLLDMLTAREPEGKFQGISIADSAETVVMAQHLIGKFLDAVEAHHQGPHLFVWRLSLLIEDSLTGVYWRREEGTEGTAEEIARAVQSSLEQVDQVRTDEDGRSKRLIGGPYLSVASITEAYRLLQHRARQAGYVVIGRSICRPSFDTLKEGPQ